MLTSLRIENFAIVSQLELDFKNGMTAFTGETGAGKSIMIDALMLALGGRADASVIRGHAEKCDITASFYIDSDSAPACWLNQHDVMNHDNEVILRRVIMAEGRSKSYINGQPFPLQKVKELSEMLVDIHGQHQHQALLHHTTHREQLDEFAHHHGLMTEVHQHYQTCQSIKQQLEHLQGFQSNHEDETDFLATLDELDTLNLQEGEILALNEEHQLLHHAREYLEQTQKIADLLSADDRPNVCQTLNHALQILTSLPAEQSNIRNCHELLNSALIQCDEALDEMHRFSNHVQLDPDRLSEIEARLSEIHQIARKHHVEVSQLPHFMLQIQEQLQDLQQADQERQLLQQKYLQAKHDYEQAALALRQSRHIHAEKLADEITQSIQELGMPKGKVMVQITPLDTFQAHGMDKVEYIVCTNPGMAPDSLAKIVSGGELSRIGLAIHIITAQRGSTPTLLFDEVDVGIGGATAALVGQLLRQLGERLQVFCVTHQPQVASCAHHHFRVEKQVEHDQTFSHVILLEEPEKIDEIARMLGGITITEQTRSHARELLGFV